MTWLLSNPIVKGIGIALLFVLSILTFGKLKKREGASEERQDAIVKDHENADEIRERVSSTRSDELRRTDRGYRD